MPFDQQRSLDAFELLMQRPVHYFSLTEERQWEEDKMIGALDVWCEKQYITDEMKQRWFKRFNVKL